MFETITWLTTNKCGMKCKYCNFINRGKEAESNKVMDTLKMFASWPNYKDRFICLLGGDVLSLPNVVDFVLLMNKLELPYGFQTSAYSDELMGSVAPYLNNLSISVDGNYSDKSRLAKQNNGLKWAERTRKINPNLDVHATITIDKDNIYLVSSLVEMLTQLKIWAEITFVHWKKKNFDLVPEKEIMNCLGEEDKKIIEFTGEYLKRKKKKGYLIHSSDYYLSNLHHVPNLDWRCSAPRNCVVETDLSMRLCLHCPGNRVRSWSVLDLKPENWLKFLSDWRLDQEEMCPNCFWDCQFEIDQIPDNMIADWFNHKG